MIDSKLTFLTSLSSEIAVGAFFFGILVPIIWLVIGWRAMKAHEALAKQAARANDIYAGSLETDGEAGDAMRERKQQFERFLRDNPEVSAMSSKDRHERFRDWLLDEDIGS